MLIQEFLPNPVGSDKEGEYVLIVNDGNNPVSLAGWRIEDAAGKTYQLSGVISAGESTKLSYTQTKLFLNNNGEQMLLYNADGVLVDTLEYSGVAEEGQIITRQLATSELVTSQTIESGVVAGMQLSMSGVITPLLASSIILAVLGVYIIVQLEKKLNITLW